MSERKIKPLPRRATDTSPQTPDNEQFFNSPAFSQNPENLPFAIEHLSLDDIFEQPNGTPKEIETKPEFVYLNCVVQSKKTSAKIYNQQSREHITLRLPKDIEPGSVITFPNQHGSWDKCMVIGFTLLDKDEPVAIEVTAPVQFLQFHHPEASGKPVTKLEKILANYPEKADGKLTTAEVQEIRKVVNIKTTQTFKRLT